ncbi:hypothetical protein FMUND_10529 [Fusarium mundagurra]|uniref:Uncharacterized protein n=1 Tax=Fusarium mundagurra TaxID=1567541 RepID=A0A8H5YC64_9HYPO|nr:hypothetical protein FMUND_10529 [Fusarium mundagurra]
MDGAASTPKSVEEEEDEYQDEYLDTAAEGAWTDEDTDVENTDAEDDMDADNYSVFSGEEDHEDSNEASEGIQIPSDSAGHLDFAAAEAGEDDASAQAGFYEELLQDVFGLSVSLPLYSVPN